MGLVAMGKQIKGMDNPFTIVVDTDEKTPWVFPAEQPVVSAALPAGDYSIMGYENTISLERKTLSDLVSTVIHDRDRFFAELVRLKKYRRKAVVIEGDVSDIFELRYKSEAHPYSILGTIQSFHLTFNVPFLWWHSREYAEWLAMKWLEQACKRTKRWEERDKEREKEEEIEVRLQAEEIY